MSLSRLLPMPHYEALDGRGPDFRISAFTMTCLSMTHPLMISGSMEVGFHRSSGKVLHIAQW
jgi:hypothetical protein